MRFFQTVRVRSLTFALVAVLCAHCGSVKGAAGGGGRDAGEPDPGAGDGGDTNTNVDAAEDANATPDGGKAETGGAIVVGTGSDSCATATPIVLSGANPRSDLSASTLGATHEIDAPCSGDQGADTFYKFTISKRVFVYADTFGASWDTVLFLLSDTCEPLTTTTPGDAVCNDNGCGSSQSQIVARLDPGTYRLGLTGRGSARGDATIHFEWARAGSGDAAHLPAVNSVQVGETSGSQGNIDGLANECVAGGPENSYWWARCPSDPATTLHASTCGGGTTWESVLETQIPKSAPQRPAAYKCNLDGCGLQAMLNTPIPAGAGLGVLSIDGQSGSDLGPYTMTVTYEP